MDQQPDFGCCGPAAQENQIMHIKLKKSFQQTPLSYSEQ